jgi:uracil-DNA glycosylase
MTKADCSTEELLRQIRQCTACTHSESPLPVTPRPVIQAARSSKIRIIGQAPGTRVHESGRPFTDASGDRLRDWLDVTSEEFYDPSLIAVTPMGFCFPGQDAKGGDLPPRRECGPLWQDLVDEALPNTELTLIIGMYAVNWHLRDQAKRNLTETVKSWRDYGPDLIPLPHPSWRNNGWIKRHDWFPELLSELKTRVREIIHG